MLPSLYKSIKRKDYNKEKEKGGRREERKGIAKVRKERKKKKGRYHALSATVAINMDEIKKVRRNREAQFD